jgi:hypothetical protein
MFKIRACFVDAKSDAVLENWLSAFLRQLTATEDNGTSSVRAAAASEYIHLCNNKLRGSDLDWNQLSHHLLGLSGAQPSWVAFGSPVQSPVA